MLPFLLLKRNIKEGEEEIHVLFREYVYQKTGWKMGFSDGYYTGKTLERFNCFREGFLSARASAHNSDYTKCLDCAEGIVWLYDINIKPELIAKTIQRHFTYSQDVVRNW